MERNNYRINRKMVEQNQYRNKHRQRKRKAVHLSGTNRRPRRRRYLKKMSDRLFHGRHHRYIDNDRKPHRNSGGRRRIRLAHPGWYTRDNMLPDKCRKHSLREDG